MRRTLATAMLGFWLLGGLLHAQSFEQITNNAHTDHEYGVSMSADGNTLAWFISFPGSNQQPQEILIRDVTAAKTKQLVTGLPYLATHVLALSGDGSTLVYGWQQQLWTIPVAGGTPKKLTTLTTHIVEYLHGLSISDNGSLVCCTTRPTNNWVSNVEVINTVTGQRTNITNGTISEACRGAISGDGKTVAFSARRVTSSSPGQVWLANSDGSNIRQMTSFTQGSTGKTRLDRRGTVCAFEHYSGLYNTSGGIYSVLTRSKIVTHLSKNPGQPDLHPEVSADGDRITWRSTRPSGGILLNEIYMAYPEGSVPRRITTFNDQDPTQGEFKGHAINHDGTVLAILSGSDLAGKKQPDCEIWMFTDGIRQSGRANPGTEQTFWLQDPGAAGEPYLVRCALSRGPGIRLPNGAMVPLAPDALFRFSGMVPWVFRRFAGQLDAKGRATASVTIPNAPVLVGVPFFTSYVAGQNSIRVHNPVRTEITAHP